VSYLLDSNVLLELTKGNPCKSVIKWVELVPNEKQFISVLTLGELRKGIDGTANVKRRERLRLWLEHDLAGRFAGRVLPIGIEVAERWGQLLSSVGCPVPAIDSLIAATALHHELRVATRNVARFSGFEVEIFNPWDK